MMNKALVLSPVFAVMNLLGHAWADKYFVLGNTKVHTVDKSRPHAEAIAIDEKESLLQLEPMQKYETM